MQRFTRGLHFNPQGDVLCVYQNKWKLWVPPGGVIEDSSGETPLEALAREFDEELGIRPVQSRLVHKGLFAFKPLGGDKPDDWYGFIYLVLSFTGNPMIKEPTKHAAYAHMPIGCIHPQYQDIAQRCRVGLAIAELIL